MIDPFILYAIRWQISTLILCPVVAIYPAIKANWKLTRGQRLPDRIKSVWRSIEWPSRTMWEATILANLIGAVAFYNFDDFFIFQ
jgi:hypothetical protein